MAQTQPANEGMSVVMRGHFNPAIITPGWLMAKGLLGESDATDVQDQTIMGQASLFSVSWLRCEAIHDRIALHATDPLDYERLRDVAVGILDSLPETPVALLGVNRFFHYPLETEDEWHAIGDRLAPKELWSGVLALPGTLAVTIQGVRPDEFLGWVRVRTEPSKAIPQGLFVEVNDHYVLEKTEVTLNDRSDFADEGLTKQLEAVTPSSDRIPLAREILTDRWQASLDQAARIAVHVVSS